MLPFASFRNQRFFCSAWLQRAALRWLSLIWVVSVCLSSAVALAQSEADRATARALAEEGFKALKKRDYGVAEDRFRRADALVHAPTLVVDRGRALMGLKRYVEAQEQFELVLREGIPDNAPRVWKKALVDAKVLLGEVKPKVAWLTISVPDIDDPQIQVDGQAIPSAALGVRRATNPGTRTINVSAEGYAPRQVTIELTEGAEQAVEVALDPLPEDQKPKQARPSKKSGSPMEDRGPARDPTLTYVALGVGAAGIVAGSVTGIIALKKRSDLAEVCPGGRCPTAQQPEIDSYHRWSWISGISFGVGLAGAAAGLVLLLTDDGGASAQSAPASVQLYAGLGEAGIKGEF